MTNTFFDGLTDRNKRLAILGAVGVGAFFLVWGGIAQPALKRLKAIEVEKSQLLNKEPLLRGIVDNEGRFAEYNKYLTKDRDLSPLIQELATLAEKSSIRVASISPDKNITTSLEGGAEKLSISMEGEGSFHNLGNFISHVENLDRFVKISRVDFGHGSTGPGVKRLALGFTVFYASGELGAA